MNHLKHLVAGAAAALLLAASPAHAAGGGDDPDAGAFTAKPSEQAPQDKAGTFFKLKLDAGTTRRQSILIENLSGAKKHLILDAVDGRTATTSGSVYTNREDPKQKAGTWLTLPVENLYLKPHETLRIPFAINTPANATPGDHLAGISIQDAHRRHSGQRLSVTQIIRVVVGVQISVKGPTNYGLTLGAVAMKALPGTKVPSVVIHMENTGRRLCKPILDVNLSGSGATQQNVTKELDTVLPGEAIDFPLPWTHPLQAGTYQVSAQAKNCGQAVATQASATLGSTLLGTPSQPDPPRSVVVVKQAGFPVAALIGGMLAVALLMSGLMVFLLRRKRPEPHPA